VNARVEFVSYNGAYPNLCSGALVLSVDGVQMDGFRLSSGGSVSFDDDWNENVSRGPWSISDFPDGFPEDIKSEAEAVVNAHVDCGCCGGCV
jgi:hypothetical protein